MSKQKTNIPLNKIIKLMESAGISEEERKQFIKENLGKTKAGKKTVKKNLKNKKRTLTENRKRSGRKSQKQIIAERKIKRATILLEKAQKDLQYDISRLVEQARDFELSNPSKKEKKFFYEKISRQIQAQANKVERYLKESRLKDFKNIIKEGKELEDKKLLSDEGGELEELEDEDMGLEGEDMGLEDEDMGLEDEDMGLEDEDMELEDEDMDLEDEDMGLEDEDMGEFEDEENYAGESEITPEIAQEIMSGIGQVLSDISGMDISVDISDEEDMGLEDEDMDLEGEDMDFEGEDMGLEDEDMDLEGEDTGLEDEDMDLEDEDMDLEDEDMDLEEEEGKEDILAEKIRREVRKALRTKKRK